MKAYENLYFQLFSIQIALGTLLFLLFESFRHEFIISFHENLVFNFFKLSICFLSIAFWVMSVGYLYMISSKSLLFDIEADDKSEFLISRTIVFLKDSFVIAIISFFVLYL